MCGGVVFTWDNGLHPHRQKAAPALALELVLLGGQPPGAGEQGGEVADQDGVQGPRASELRPETPLLQRMARAMRANPLVLANWQGRVLELLRPTTKPH